jgi:hypothetical protein
MINPTPNSIPQEGVGMTMSFIFSIISPFFSSFSAIFVKKIGMTQALITTETPHEMKKILDLFKKNKMKFGIAFIESNPVAISENNHPIKDNEWILPGRPANPSERKRHAEKISHQRGGMTSEDLRKEIASCRKGR